MKLNTLLTLTLATASIALAQTPSAGSIESQLRDLRVEKTRVADAFDQIAFYHPSHISVESHLDSLGVVKESVNRANSIIRKLDSQRSAMSPAQQVRFNEFISQTASVAGLTNQLLKQLRADRTAYLMDAYKDSVKEAYAQASGARKVLNDLIASTSPASMQSGD